MKTHLAQKCKESNQTLNPQSNMKQEYEKRVANNKEKAKSQQNQKGFRARARKLSVEHTKKQK